MTRSLTHSLSVRISNTGSHGQIDRADGESVQISDAELGAVLLDISAAYGVGGQVGRAKYRQEVLAEWFTRLHGARPSLRLAS